MLLNILKGAYEIYVNIKFTTYEIEIKKNKLRVCTTVYRHFTDRSQSILNIIFFFGFSHALHCNFSVNYKLISQLNVCLSRANNHLCTQLWILKIREFYINIKSAAIFEYNTYFYFCFLGN